MTCLPPFIKTNVLHLADRFGIPTVESILMTTFASRLLLPAALALAPVAASAQIFEVAETCSDPMTTGLQKKATFEATGWQVAEPEVDGNLLDLATAHIISFTNGMPDLEERYSAAPVLAQNFANMIADGDITLYTRDDTLLAVLVAQTTTGTEHFACYYASSPTPDTLVLMSRYGEPEILPHLELEAKRFDEMAFNSRDDVSYQMYSMWAISTSDPARGPLTHAYRLERIEEE